MSEEGKRWVGVELGDHVTAIDKDCNVYLTTVIDGVKTEIKFTQEEAQIIGKNIEGLGKLVRLGNVFYRV